MKKIRFFLPALAVGLAGGGVFAADAPQTAPANATFRDKMMDVLFVDAPGGKKHGYLLTSQALYESDGDPAKWRATFPLIGKRVLKFAGGSEKGVLFLSDDAQTYVSPGEHHPLCSYSAAEGYHVLDQRLPAFGWDFISDKQGALAEGKSLEVTKDGGKTWVKTPIPAQSRAPDMMRFTHWATPEKLLMSDGMSVWLYTIAADGTGTQVWTAPSVTQRPLLAASGDQLWVGNGRFNSLDVATGQTVQSITTNLRMSKLAIQGKYLWIAGEGEVDLWSVADNKISDKAAMERQPAKTIAPFDAESAVLVTYDGKFFRMSLNGIHPQALTLEVDNTLIDKEVARIADAPLRDEAGQPSPNEIRTMLGWAVKAGKVGQEDVETRAGKETFATPRDRMLWKTKELQKYVEVHGVVGPIMPPHDPQEDAQLEKEVGGP